MKKQVSSMQTRQRVGLLGASLGGTILIWWDGLAVIHSSEILCVLADLGAAYQRRRGQLRRNLEIYLVSKSVVASSLWSKLPLEGGIPPPKRAGI